MAVGSNATVVAVGNVVVGADVVVGAVVGDVVAGTVVVGKVVVGGAAVGATTSDVVDKGVGTVVRAGRARGGELEVHAASINPAASTAKQRAVDDQAAVVARVGDRSRLVPCRTRGALAAGVPKAAPSAFAFQFGHEHDAALLHPLDDELGDAVSSVNPIRLSGVGVDEWNLEFTPIPRVDQARGVQDGHAVLGCEAAAGLHKPGIASGNRQRKTRRDHGATTVWREQSILPGEQIEAGVTLPGVGGRR
jgi:hypothetical protein